MSLSLKRTGPIMFPAALPALYRLMMDDFFVWPAVLAAIQLTISGLPPNRKDRR